MQFQENGLNSDTFMCDEFLYNRGIHEHRGNGVKGY